MRANVNLKDRVNSGSRASPEIFEGSPSKRLVFGKSQSLNTRQQKQGNQMKRQRRNASQWTPKKFPRRA